MRRLLFNIGAFGLIVLLGTFGYKIIVRAQTTGCTTPTPATGLSWGSKRSLTLYIDPALSDIETNSNGTEDVTRVGIYNAYYNALGTWGESGISVTITSTQAGADISILSSPNVVDQYGISRLAATSYTTTTANPTVFQTTTINVNTAYVDPSTGQRVYNPAAVSSSDPSASMAAASFSTKLFGHELGHAVGGLADVTPDNQTNYTQTPEGSIMNRAVGQNDIGGGLPVSMTTCDKQTFQKTYPVTNPSGTGGSGGGSGSGGGTTPTPPNCSFYCSPPPPPPPPPSHPCPNEDC